MPILEPFIQLRFHLEVTFPILIQNLYNPFTLSQYRWSEAVVQERHGWRTQLNLVYPKKVEHKKMQTWEHWAIADP